MRLMWTPRDPKGKARSPRVQPTVSRQDALAAPQLSSHPQACPLQQPKVKCSKFECGRRAGSSGPIVGPPGLRRPELVRLPETLGRVAAGLLSAPQLTTPLREGAAGVSAGTGVGEEEQRKEARRGHLTSPC
ncbi:PREDICTED: uncharacterized protein LOC108543767 [Rhinopithecus bieti]|uniref:uncharacterized protein LOC108543767 n=1 Tax=Rhinopithecus bieti TaxID=61621 RepID=UPI00083C4C1F|nr:PREDICTED: uncharacterized protein LOC108543767 [Rhinopithecus bieti]